MDRREIREDCYKDMLEDSIIGVESVLNHLRNLKSKDGLFDEKILLRDKIRTYYDLELSLANMCILLRKMAENNFIDIEEGTRKDINSIIHSNKFEYHNQECLYVYSQKGREEVSITDLLLFARRVCKH